jgi:hypothetical protein
MRSNARGPGMARLASLSSEVRHAGPISLSPTHARPASNHVSPPPRATWACKPDVVGACDERARSHLGFAVAVGATESRGLEASVWTLKI